MKIFMIPPGSETPEEIILDPNNELQITHLHLRGYRQAPEVKLPAQESSSAKEPILKTASDAKVVKEKN